MIKILFMEGRGRLIKVKALNPIDALDEFNKKVFAIWGIRYERIPDNRRNRKRVERGMKPEAPHKKLKHSEV